MHYDLAQDSLPYKEPPSELGQEPVWAPETTVSGLLGPCPRLLRLSILLES